VFNNNEKAYSVYAQFKNAQKTRQAQAQKNADDEFDVDAFLAASSFEPDNVFHRGQRGRILRGKPCSVTGFTIQISEGFGQLRGHTEAATDFLREHEMELARLSRYPGVAEVYLDFGYDRRPEAAVQCDYLPPELLGLAGSLGIGIVLSLYPSSNESEMIETEDPNIG
jgi:hypothetical protein